MGLVVHGRRTFDEGPNLLHCAQAPGLKCRDRPPSVDSALVHAHVALDSALRPRSHSVGQCFANGAKPLTRHDVEIDADASDAVIDESQHYPYFIQLWGDALWQWHLAKPNACLTTAATAAVQGAVTARVANYYEGRCQELAAAGLLPAATAIALLFQDSMDATASNQEVDAALLAAGLNDSVDRFAASEGLNRLSYMWRPPGQLPPVLWSVGIPSLTTYVLEHAPESARRNRRPQGQGDNAA